MAEVPLYGVMEMPLDYAADQPSMLRYGRRYEAELRARWGARMAPGTLRWQWGVKGSERDADPETGKIRTAEWDGESPVPSWAVKLLLAIVAEHAPRHSNRA